MNPLCVVIALTMVSGGDPTAEEIGRFETRQGCNAAIVENLDRFDRLLTFDLDADGRPIPRQPSYGPVTYLEGYRPLAFPYLWESPRPYRRWKHRHGRHKPF